MSNPVPPVTSPEAVVNPSVPKVDINIRNAFSLMVINGQEVALNQSNRVSLNFEGSSQEVADAANNLLASLPAEWSKLQQAAALVLNSPLQDEFGAGDEPTFVLSLSVRQVLTRHDEQGDDDDIEIDDDLEGEEA